MTRTMANGRVQALRIFGAVVILTSSASASPPAAPPPTRSYALPLGLSYAALPLLAAGSAAAFPNANETQGALLVTSVIAVGLAAPIAVHATYGQPGRAVVSPFGTLGSVLVSGLVGAGIGGLVADATCPSGKESSDASRCEFGAVLPAVYVGAAVGYAAWAVFDTVSNSGLEEQTPSSVTIAPTISHSSAGVDVLGTF